MAGGLEQIRRSKKKLVIDNVSSAKINQKAMELQAAMEILAEVFGTDISEIDEVLKQRCEESLEMPKVSYLRRKRWQGEPLLRHRYSEAEGWPREFSLTD